jgi:hypothetical protein
MTNLTFRLTPAADTSVDPQYDLLADGSATGIAIQDCRSYGGGWAVSECGNEGTDDIWVQDIGSSKSLKTAQAIAIKHFRSRVAAVKHFKVEV